MLFHKGSYEVFSEHLSAPFQDGDWVGRLPSTVTDDNHFGLTKRPDSGLDDFRTKAGMRLSHLGPALLWKVVVPLYSNGLHDQRAFQLACSAREAAACI